MRIVRLFACEELAGGAHVVNGDAFGYAGAVFAQPLVEPYFGALDDWRNFPEGIIEVERDGTDICQHK